MKKLKIGFYGITGCAGCQLSVIFEEDELLDIINLIEIQAWPFIKELNYDKKFDYIFMEGLVADNEDKGILLKLRANTRFMVALGACAHTGCIPAYRHFTLKENYAHLLYEKKENIKDIDPNPIDSFVKVDYIIPGCPPDKNEIRSFIKDIVRDIIPKPYNNPVCVECKRNNNSCLLDNKKPCLGPITRGGCNSVCTNNGLECWGCRGPTDDSQIKIMVDLLINQKYDKKMIKDRLVTFSGTKMPEVKRFVYGKRD